MWFLARIAVFICYFFALSLVGFVFCTKRYFGYASIDQILFAYVMDRAGSWQADRELIILYCKYTLLYPGLLSLLLTFSKSLLSILYSCYRAITRALLYFNCDQVLRFNPLILLIISLIYFYHTFNVRQFFFTSLQADYFKQNYASLTKALLPKHKKPENLLLIYVESLEATYQRSDIFGQNFLNALLPWEAQGVRFKQFQQMPGTGWTLAGIIATQCGFPLKLVSNKQSESLNKFLPNAICLSDVLASAGYHNVFMKGASLRFSGLRHFLKAHHYDEMYGKDEWGKLGYSSHDMSGWGLYDRDLFKEAKKALARLIKSKQPFSLTLLTLNLHGPFGINEPYCSQAGLNVFQELVMCEGAMLAQFLQDLQHEGWLNNMNVVIMGDHLAMKNPLSRKLDSISDRTIYNLILPVTPVQKQREHITHFTWLPTILTLLHFDVPDAHAGLGVSAISRKEEKKETQLGQENMTFIQQQWYLPSKTYQRLWG